MKALPDTIAAVATAPGPAGIAVIRVSGPGSLAIADRVFSCAAPPPSRRAGFTAVHGFVRSGARLLDEALLLIMRAPNSYTREDVIEIQGHGGPASVRRILDAVLREGARPAGPGEFTRRAFLNGRIDLVQAEAVLDLVRAQSDRSAAAAVQQLEGRLSRSFQSLYDRLLRACADLESTLDFSDDDPPPDLLPDVIRQLDEAGRNVRELLDTSHDGHLLREGATVAVVGRPNVGKSSVFNALLGKQRAIVSSVPGTTRDTIEENLVVNGIVVRLIDTAGICETTCSIEREGVRRARAEMEASDYRIHVCDSSISLDDNELSIIKSMDPKTTAIVFNKTDLGIKSNPESIHNFRIIYMQAIYEKGISDLLSAIKEMICLSDNMESQPSISSRHSAILDNVSGYISDSRKILSSGEERFFVPAVSSIRMALEEIGMITGKTYHPAMLDSIFSRFCVGK